jgi:PAS domain S-box-containing protein
MVVTEPLGTSAYRALYENSPDGVMFTIPDGTILAANPAACRILGRTEAEICSLGRQAMADPTDGRWGPLVTERSRSGVAQGIARMIRGDGVAIEVEMSSLVFHDAEDAERSCTIIRDVTDRVAMEHELRRSRERLAEAEHVAEMGSWEWDISGGHVSWSDGLLAMYGVARDHFGGSVDAAEELVYPGDLKRVRGVLRQAVTERSSSFTFENRVLRTDGRVRTVRSRGEVVVDESGEPIRMVGITQDITNAKLAQEPGRGPAPGCRWPHQRGDLSTAVPQRGDGEMAREADPRDDRFVDPRGSGRPSPWRLALGHDGLEGLRASRIADA